MARLKALVDRDTGAVVCESCTVANTPLRRMRGLLGRESLRSGEGLLLQPAPMIHTWFMRFAIDAVFLDRELAVIDVAEQVRPWRAAGRRGARSVLELPAGEAGRRGLRPGARMRLEDGARG